MAKPYSEDLRRRVVEAIDGGATIPDAAEQCGVRISSVVRFLKLHRDTGSVSAAKFGGYKDFVLPTHEELVRSLIEEQPDITLAELKARLAKKKVSVGKSSISRFLNHLKLSFKKSLRAAEQDRPDIAAARKALRRRQALLIPRQLVFIDETAVSTTITRLYGAGREGGRLSPSQSRVLLHGRFQAGQRCFARNAARPVLRPDPARVLSSRGRSSKGPDRLLRRFLEYVRRPC